MKNTKKQRHPVAGIVVVRNFNDEWHVLGLKDGGEMDITKGRIDSNETAFDCALRETEEESGLNYEALIFSWGTNPLIIQHATIFVAETKSDPEILKNPDTGLFEHESAHWLRWNDLKTLCYPYLIDVINWAEAVVEDR